jgi:hypothetical protein
VPTSMCASPTRSMTPGCATALRGCGASCALERASICGIDCRLAAGRLRRHGGGRVLPAERGRTARPDWAGQAHIRGDCADPRRRAEAAPAARAGDAGLRVRGTWPPGQCELYPLQRSRAAFRGVERVRHAGALAAAAAVVLSRCRVRQLPRLLSRGGRPGRGPAPARRGRRRGGDGRARVFHAGLCRLSYAGPSPRSPA